MQTQINSELKSEILSRGRVLFEKDGIKLVALSMDKNNIPFIKKIFKPGRYTFVREFECYGCGYAGMNDIRRYGVIYVIPDDYEGSDLFFDLLEKEGYDVGESGAERATWCSEDGEVCDYEGYDFIDKEIKSFDELIKELEWYPDTHLGMVEFIVPIKG